MDDPRVTPPFHVPWNSAVHGSPICFAIARGDARSVSSDYGNPI
ncbi:MAG: hypothetical protein R3C99_05975 [Pirellulaceae bacterium]